MTLSYRDTVAALFKTCSSCREGKPASAFGRDNRALDGLRSRCRSCRKAIERSEPTDFWAFVDTSMGSLGCWIWTGHVGRGGYGLAIGQSGQLRRAHHIAWEQLRGPRTPGMDLCHHCDTPRCVNPLHLFEGTEFDNMRDMARKGRHGQAKKTHCVNGHKFDRENTNTSRGYRRCRACCREYTARLRRQKLEIAS